ncbi:hypothetical protein BJX68DRAFT_224198 [Aspergillus pseudodeflectus]|uniref:Uncharacterized protein n=1 Tax=Aspergillus pseudodeflectus TaxID=176178 RepID=A0ABR4L679_9EURO
MAAEHRITESNPIRHLGHMDYERCAALHNELLFRGWTGAGNEWIQPPTWWEYYSPPDALASRLHPSLIEFLKRAYNVLCDTIESKNNWQSLFFFINCLAVPKDIVSLLDRDMTGPDRFLLLYVSSGFMLGDEQGILFDQHTCKATYVVHVDDTRDTCLHEWAWMPLEVILDSYLQMADEGKVSIVRDFSYEIDSDNEDDEEPSIEEPWMMNPYSKTDVSKAVAALRRLITAIESRMGETTTTTKPEIPLPWHDPVTLNQAFIPPDSFAHVFLSAVSTWTVRFRYLAPGIRFPTIAEFLDQGVGELEYPGGCSLRVFQMDPEEGQGGAGGQNMRSRGLFIDNVVTRHPEYFANGSSLRLPFAIGRNRKARMSNGELIRVRDHDSLYQQAWLSNGIDHGHSVQIHKVLDSWAERVEQGDWVVGEDGVQGGVGKFREADTEEHWRKYWIPLSW